MVDTVSKGTRTSLHDAQLPKKYWGYAAVYIVNCQCYNYLPALGNLTPGPGKLRRRASPTCLCSVPLAAEQQSSSVRRRRTSSTTSSHHAAKHASSWALATCEATVTKATYATTRKTKNSTAPSTLSLTRLSYQPPLKGNRPARARTL